MSTTLPSHLAPFRVATGALLMPDGSTAHPGAIVHLDPAAVGHLAGRIVPVPADDPALAAPVAGAAADADVQTSVIDADTPANG